MRALIVVGLVACTWLAFSGGGTAGAGDRFPDLRVEQGEAKGHIDAARKRAPASARAALADGKVTGNEYRAAVDRTLSCLRTDGAARGITVSASAPELSSDAFEYGYTYRVTYRGPEALAVADAISGIEQSCQARHLVDVQWTYQLAKRSDPAYVDQVARTFEACAREAGVDVDTRGKDAVDVAVEMSNPEVAKAHPGSRACIGAAPSITTDVRTDPMEHTRR